MHIVSNMQGVSNSSSGSSSMQRALVPAMATAHAKEVAGKCNSSIQKQQ